MLSQPAFPLLPCIVFNSFYSLVKSGLYLPVLLLHPFLTTKTGGASVSCGAVKFIRWLRNGVITRFTLPTSFVSSSSSRCFVSILATLSFHFPVEPRFDSPDYGFCGLRPARSSCGLKVGNGLSVSHYEVALCFLPDYLSWLSVP